MFSQPRERVTLIAEIGSNHDRDMGKARMLIEAAAAAGWDAVKFQLFQAAWLYPENCGVVETPSGRVDFYELLHQAELPSDWLAPLKRHAEGLGLSFLCTAFDEAGVESLENVGVAAIKIASPELNHLPLLRAAARAGLPLVCSTGVSTLSDIEEALATITAVRPRATVALLQCTTAYPAPEEEANLAVIGTLSCAFGRPVGLSDHTMDIQAVPAVAVAAGATIIEKHVTASRAQPGADHAFAIEPDEMRRMAAVVRDGERVPPAQREAWAVERVGRDRVARILGHGRKEIMPSEAPLYPCDKRSIVAIRPIAADEELSQENVRILRSERNLRPGLHPRFWEQVLGARLARGVALGDGIRWEHLLRR